MDRNLSKEEIRHERRKKWLRIAVPVAGIGIAASVIIGLARSGVNRSELTLGTVDRGDVESTIQAGGKVVPGFEEIITSPISSRIVEVYSRAGDKVEAGTPLLRLDLESTETEISKQRDARQKLVYNIEQQELANATELTNLEMEIKVKEMAVNRLEAEVANEKRLDDLGSGTGDRVREAELAYRTGCIQLEQLRRRLANERRMRAAAIEGQRLDLSIAERNLGTQLKTLEDARLRSPRAATLTFIVNEVGKTVVAGEKIATIADLSSFKVDAEISESNARLLSAGSKANVRVGRNIYTGTVVNVSPVATNGAVTFSVVFDDTPAENLRSGLAADVFVVRDVRRDVLRLPMGPYYSRGAGQYELFVEHEEGELEKRVVTLGTAGYDYVEVVGGLEPGDRVALSDMSGYSRRKYRIDD